MAVLNACVVVFSCTGFRAFTPILCWCFIFKWVRQQTEYQTISVVLQYMKARWKVASVYGNRFNQQIPIPVSLRIPTGSKTVLLNEAL